MSEETKADKSPELVGDAGAKAEESGQADGSGKGGKKVSRRQVVAGAIGGLVVGAAAGAGIAYGVEERGKREEREANADLYALSDITNVIDLGIENPYYDQPHPCGIKPTVWPRYAVYVTFDMRSSATKKDLQTLLALWTAKSSMMQAGQLMGQVRPDSDNAVPGDNGSTDGLYTANLYIIIGFGPKLFDQDRYGLEEFRPEGFYELPFITGDKFEQSAQGHDFGMWIKGDDWQVIYNAVRNLATIARPYATMTYSHKGYLSSRQHGIAGTSRSIHGFIVGLTGVSSDEQYDQYVWIKDSGQEWLDGGTYMVYRDTHIYLEDWDADRIGDQEACIGRSKKTGAWLSNPEGSPFDPADFEAKDENGDYLIPRDSHCYLVDESHMGFMCFGDGYRYWRGLLDNGYQDAGIIDVFFQNDLQHFIDLRNTLGRYDQCNEYYDDMLSGTYAIPQSPATGHYIGEQFFA